MNNSLSFIFQPAEIMQSTIFLSDIYNLKLKHHYFAIEKIVADGHLLLDISVMLLRTCLLLLLLPVVILDLSFGVVGGRQPTRTLHRTVLVTRSPRPLQ